MHFNATEQTNQTHLSLTLEETLFANFSDLNFPSSVADNQSSLLKNGCIFQDMLSNSTSTGDMPQLNMAQLVAYCALFPFAAIGNILIFLALIRNRHRKSRVNLMILHLSLADMLVTFIFLPVEITWNITIQWTFGGLACKAYKFLAAFGFYMSSMVLVCISLDRYFAVVHPLKVNDAQRRGKMMLLFAWIISAVISLPQSVIFNVEAHPLLHDFYQCVTFGFFMSNPDAEMIYTIFCISFLYFIPLAIIIVAYTRIIIEISKKSHDNKGAQNMQFATVAYEIACVYGGNIMRSLITIVLRAVLNAVNISSLKKETREGRFRGRSFQLRRSNTSNIEKARIRTLRMTFIIVLAFVWCWTPYSLATLWNFIDPETFKNMNKHLQDIFFIIAVSNSVVNPLIYGRYSVACSRGCCFFPSCSRCCLPDNSSSHCTGVYFCRRGTSLSRSNGTIYTNPTRGRRMVKTRGLFPEANRSTNNATFQEMAAFGDSVNYKTIIQKNRPRNEFYRETCLLERRADTESEEPIIKEVDQFSSGYSSSSHAQSFRSYQEPGNSYERLRNQDALKSHHSC